LGGKQKMDDGSKKLPVFRLPFSKQIDPDRSMATRVVIN